MKKIILLFLLVTNSVPAQREDRSGPPKLNYMPTNGVIAFPLNDSTTNCFYLARIFYGVLVFEKEGTEYVSNFRLQVEIYDSVNNLVRRELKNNSIKTERFEITTDRKNYQNNLLEFELPPGQYEFRTIISDLNSDIEIKLKPELINILSVSKEKILFPLIVHDQQIKCTDADNYYSIANFSGSIPFSPEMFSMIIPVVDTTVQKLHVQIIAEEDTILSEVFEESVLMNMSIGNCDDKIYLMNDDEKIITRNFLIRNINENLYEGPVTINILAQEHGYQREIITPVIWIDKPFSLFDSEMAIKFLEFIESDDVVTDLLSEDEEDYTKLLMNYWKKFDPESSSTFNPLVQEYYERIDFADKEYRGLGKDTGLNSDRGKIYVRFGKPQEISRSSDANGNVVETWNYSNPERKFIFVDHRGTGNFTLIEG